MSVSLSHISHVPTYANVTESNCIRDFCWVHTVIQHSVSLSIDGRLNLRPVKTFEPLAFDAASAAVWLRRAPVLTPARHLRQSNAPSLRGHMTIQISAHTRAATALV